MATPDKGASNTPIGEYVKKMRRKRGLSREALAGIEFSKEYIASIERGTVMPSPKVLEALAKRLQHPVEQLRTSTVQPVANLDVRAYQEDLTYQFNYAKMLARGGDVSAASELVDNVEQSNLPYWDMLPAATAYLLPFMRARLHIQLLAPKKALPYLQEALVIAGDDREARTQINNLLGVVYFELNQPWKALRYHQQCQQSLLLKEVKNNTFAVSVYRNLANDYWATNQPEQALGVYQDILLPLVQNISDPQETARVFWGMSMAYRQLGDPIRAIGSAVSALDIYERNNTHSTEAAGVALFLAEQLIKGSRYEEASDVLRRSKQLLMGTEQLVSLSYMEKSYAEMALRQGLYDQALEHAEKAVELARKQYVISMEEENQSANQTWQNPNRPYADALHMQALIEKARDNREASKLLFEQAIGLIQPAGFEETGYNINFSYAETLMSWGEFAEAAQYYKAAAEQQHSAKRSNE